MAKRGTTKWFSIQQEERIAKAYQGKRSASSGAAVTDQGDVRTKVDLFECKHRGTFDKPARSISIKLDDFEKIVDEATAESRNGAMCFSIYAPGSPLADKDGFVDITARLTKDDLWRHLLDG